VHANTSAAFRILVFESSLLFVVSSMYFFTYSRPSRIIIRIIIITFPLELLLLRLPLLLALLLPPILMWIFLSLSLR
jgi:hypothetical protein